MKNFLSIDQGTTSSRSIIFDANLNLVTDAQEEYDLTYPEDGWVELEPKKIIETVTNTLNKIAPIRITRQVFEKLFFKLIKLFPKIFLIIKDV